MEEVESTESEAKIKPFDHIEALYETEDEFGDPNCRYSWFEL